MIALTIILMSSRPTTSQNAFPGNFNSNKHVDVGAKVSNLTVCTGRYIGPAGPAEECFDLGGQCCSGDDPAYPFNVDVRLRDVACVGCYSGIVGCPAAPRQSSTYRGIRHRTFY